MAKNIKDIVVLVSICAVIALLLAGTNAITAPVIEKNQSAAANEALLVVMPEGSDFELVEVGGYTLPSTVTEVYAETSGKGHVITLTTKGYGSDMVIMCGVNAEGVVTGAVCLSSNETLGKEKEYGQNFAGKDAAAVEAVDTIGGATLTTAAYKGAIQDALNAAIILGGGSVDIRTEEEILADNLSAALPAGEGAFSKIFLTDVLEGVDAVYAADNGAGYVFVATAEEIGEDFAGEFIGIDADGQIVTAGSTKNTAAADDAFKAVKSSALTEVDIADKGLIENITKVEISNSGNYVITINGAGYGIVGGDEWHPASGEYIVIRVAITPDGEIIDCLTVSQAETQNLGDACAKEEFYGQFAGKTQADYNTIDAISGATLTTNGYLKAIERCFEAVSILEGGAK